MNSISYTVKKDFPKSAAVACQGVSGAFSEMACRKLFEDPKITFVKSFEDVFAAVESGKCRYGMIPIENSSAGSVNRTYTLMINRKFYIVRSVVVKVEHSLLALPGTKIEDIREITSHEQALNQCAEFTSSMGVRTFACENTAVAAKTVAAAQRRDLAALSSPLCADLYGLEILRSAVQDSDSNYTRFICISREPEVYEGADRTSIMAAIPHVTGSLYKMLGVFYGLDINLLKLESRPIPGQNFRFMFYFDLATCIGSDSFILMSKMLEKQGADAVFLGSYSELS
jgi:chorismate mutase/prephenate dehydratase